MSENECGFCDVNHRFRDILIQGIPACYQCIRDAGGKLRVEGEAAWVDWIDFFSGDVKSRIADARISRLFGKPPGVVLSNVHEIVGVDRNERSLPDADELAKRYRIAINIQPVRGRRIVAVLEANPSEGRRLAEYIYADPDDELFFAPFSGEISTPKERGEV